MISFSTFQRWVKEGYNRIPVMRTVLADLDTPLSTYMKLVDGPYSYLLESVQGGEKWGRYSIIGLPCQEVVRVKGDQVTVTRKGVTTDTIQVSDPLGWVQNFLDDIKVPEHDCLPRYSGGLAGYFGYELVHIMEPRVAGKNQNDPLGCPDALLMVSNEVLVFDNLSGKLHLIVHVDKAMEGGWEIANRRLDELVSKLRSGVPDSSQAPIRSVDEDHFVSGFTKHRFLDAVEKVKQYIIEGDVMQTVLSQRLSIPYEGSSLDLYRSLRILNPSPYMFYFDFEDFEVVGSSPEILVRLENDQVTLRPIAGTRPRGSNEEEDQALEIDLLSDPKECAEHLMLIDLGRNDVGRVARTGTVELTEKMVIERYSHVMHIVSNVNGRLKPGLKPVDVLKASFPAGTVSGAPKVRAMEIINELEPVKRGVYAGALGYVGWNGNMDTAIAIRTAVIKDKTLYIQVGAGIVADSVPENEWQETMNKGRAIFKAVDMALSGLRVDSPG